MYAIPVCSCVNQRRRHKETIGSALFPVLDSSLPATTYEMSNAHRSTGSAVEEIWSGSVYSFQPHLTSIPHCADNPCTGRKDNSDGPRQYLWMARSNIVSRLVPVSVTQDTRKTVHTHGRTHRTDRAGVVCSPSFNRMFGQFGAISGARSSPPARYLARTHARTLFWHRLNALLSKSERDSSGGELVEGQ